MTEIIVTEEDIKKILRNFKTYKSQGMDKIHPLFLKELSHEISIPSTQYPMKDYLVNLDHMELTGKLLNGLVKEGNNKYQLTTIRQNGMKSHLKYPRDRSSDHFRL